jgi:hypothetical protein
VGFNTASQMRVFVQGAFLHGHAWGVHGVSIVISRSGSFSARGARVFHNINKYIYVCVSKI